MSADHLSVKCLPFQRRRSQHIVGFWLPGRENSRKLSEFKWNPEAGLRFIVPLSDPGLPPVTRGEGISSGTNSQVQLVGLSTPQ